MNQEHDRSNNNSFHTMGPGDGSAAGSPARKDDLPLLEVGGSAAMSSDGTPYAVAKVSVDGEVGHGHGRSSWLTTAFIIAGEVMGTGVMGLPAACAGLGWFIGTIALFFCGAAAVYAGILLGRVRNQFYPEAKSYTEVAREAVGPGFGKFTKYITIVYWATLLPYYLMAAATSLDLGFEGWHLCYYEWAILLMIMLALPLQLRSFHQLRYAAVLSDLAVVLVLVLTLGDIVASGRSGANGDDKVIKAAETELFHEGAEFIDSFKSLSSFVYAFAGHSMFLELMSEMVDSNDFAKSMYVSNGFMFAVYGLTMSIGYYYRGTNVDGFLPGSVPAGLTRTVVCVGLTYHIMCSYVINNLPLCQLVSTSIWPDFEGDRSRRGWRWAKTTLGFLVLAYIIANMIPFFAAFQSIIGSLLAAPVMFFFPPYLYLRSARALGQPVPPLDRLVCNFFIYVVNPAMMVLGFIASCKTLIKDWSTFGKPFGCHLEGYK